MQRGAGFGFGEHTLAGLALDFGQGLHQMGAVVGVGDVMGDGGVEQSAEILRRVGQRRVRTDRDAVHALGAVFGDEERGLAAGYVLRGGVAGGRGDHPHGGEGRGGLMVAELGAELGVEAGDGGERRARGLAGRQRVSAATGAATGAIGRNGF